MPKLNSQNHNTKLRTTTLGDVELKYISGGDLHKYVELMGDLKEVGGKLELQKDNTIGDRDFTLKILHNQLLKPEMSFEEFQKTNDGEIVKITKTFMENETSFFEFYKEKDDFFESFRSAVEKKIERDIEPMKKTASDALKRVRAITENIQNILPKVDVPKIFDIEDPGITSFKSPEIIQEENNWERHTQLLEVQEGILNEQRKGQKKNIKLTWVVIIISALTFIVSIVGVVHSMFDFDWLSNTIDQLFKR